MSKKKEIVTYDVVETFENGNRSVTTSPEIWIGNNILSWPPTGAYTKRKNPTPPEDGWRKIPCKILAKGFKSLKSALAKERKLSVFSNTESENEDMQRRALKRLHPVRYDDPIDCNEEFNKIKAAKGIETSQNQMKEISQNQMKEIIFDPVVPDEIFASETVDSSGKEKDLNAILSIVGHNKDHSSSYDYAPTLNSEKGQVTSNTADTSHATPSAPISISCNGQVIQELSSASLNVNLASSTQHPHFVPISHNYSQGIDPLMVSSTYTSGGHILPNYNYHPHYINYISNGGASYTQSGTISGQYQSGGQILPSNYSQTNVSSRNSVDNRPTTDLFLQQLSSNSLNANKEPSAQYTCFNVISPNYSQGNASLLKQHSSSFNPNRTPSTQYPCFKITSPSNVPQTNVASIPQKKSVNNKQTEYSSPTEDGKFKKPLAVAKYIEKRQGIQNEDNLKLVKNKNNKISTKQLQMVKGKKQVLKPNLPMKQLKQVKKAFSTQGKDKTRQNECISLNALKNNVELVDDADTNKDHNVQPTEYLKLIYKEVLAMKTFNKNEAAKRKDMDKKIVDISQKLSRIEGEMLQLKSSNKSNLQELLLEQEQIQEFDAYFSITAKEELDTFIFKLKRDPVYKKLLVIRLARIGGAKPQLMLRKIMRYLIDDSLLQLFTWTEPKPDTKPAFKELEQINTTILQSIQLQHPLYTEDLYNKYMSSYVKQAKFRQKPSNNGAEVEEEDDDENDDEEENEGRNENRDVHENGEVDDDGEDDDEIVELRDLDEDDQ